MIQTPPDILLQSPPSEDMELIRLSPDAAKPKKRRRRRRPGRTKAHREAAALAAKMGKR